MTKKEEEVQKNKITWRLSDLPNAGEVADLVNSGVLSVEEARQILIKEEVPKSQAEEIAALKDMVKALQETVKDLLSRPNFVNVPYVRTIEVQPRQRPYWDNVFMSNTAISGTSGVALTKLTTTGSGNATYSISNNL